MKKFEKTTFDQIVASYNLSAWSGLPKGVYKSVEMYTGISTSTKLIEEFANESAKENEVGFKLITSDGKEAVIIPKGIKIVGEDNKERRLPSFLLNRLFANNPEVEKLFFQTEGKGKNATEVLEFEGLILEVNASDKANPQLLCYGVAEG